MCAARLKWTYRVRERRNSSEIFKRIGEKEPQHYRRKNVYHGLDWNRNGSSGNFVLIFGIFEEKFGNDALPVEVTLNAFLLPEWQKYHRSNKQVCALFTTKVLQLKELCESGLLGLKLFLTKTRLQDLVREVDPTEQLDEEVEEMLLQLADDFVETTVNAACLLAKHRHANTVEVKDVQLHLERNWNMWIPGFGTDEVRPYKRATVTEAHKQRLALIRKSIKKY